MQSGQKMLIKHIFNLYSDPINNSSAPITIHAISLWITWNHNSLIWTKWGWRSERGATTNESFEMMKGKWTLPNKCSLTDAVDQWLKQWNWTYLYSTPQLRGYKWNPFNYRNKMTNPWIRVQHSNKRITKWKWTKNSVHHSEFISFGLIHWICQVGNANYFPLIIRMLEW